MDIKSMEDFLEAAKSLGIESSTEPKEGYWLVMDKHGKKLYFDIERRFLNVKKWYKENFEDDELGEELNENVTFYDVLEALQKGKDVYEVFGVGDSVVRERIFERLSKLCGVTYEEIYYLWIEGGN